jgi:hypothetical protein
MRIMFNLADYEPVEVRLEKFIKDYPDFRISTELEVIESNRYVVKAYLFKTATDSVAWATGLAEETVTSRGVNQTSALENCETSAIGRALANAGYAPKGKRPSREEMTKVKNSETTFATSSPLKEPIKDYWTTPFGEQDEFIKQVPAPSTMEAAVNTVADILGTDKDTPHCPHGTMVWKAGVTKTGKPWGHYKCSGAANGHNDRCPKDQDVVWYEIKPDGSWGAQKARG